MASYLDVNTPGWKQDVSDISEAIWEAERAWGTFGHMLSSFDQVRIARSIATRHSIARLKPDDVLAAFEDAGLRRPTQSYGKTVVKNARALLASSHQENGVSR